MNPPDVMQSDKWDHARGVLGVDEEATDEQLRQAYVEQVRRFPPDREPERFEQIRDAYDLLKDPVRRAQRVLAVTSPVEPLVNLLGSGPAKRAFVGPELWLGVLKEKRS